MQPTEEIPTVLAPAQDDDTLPQSKAEDCIYQAFTIVSVLLLLRSLWLF